MSSSLKEALGHVDTPKAFDIRSQKEINYKGDQFGEGGQGLMLMGKEEILRFEENPCLVLGSTLDRQSCISLRTILIKFLGYLTFVIELYRKRLFSR